jgi:hypothetical protein
MVKFNEEIQTKMIDNDSMEEEEEENSVVKEDIYGRTVDAKGNVVKNKSSEKNSILPIWEYPNMSHSIEFTRIDLSLGKTTKTSVMKSC